ncbi:unnamed protein product, partial [Linum tenue]
LIPLSISPFLKLRFCLSSPQSLIAATYRRLQQLAVVVAPQPVLAGAKSGPFFAVLCGDSATVHYFSSQSTASPHLSANFSSSFPVKAAEFPSGPVLRA